MSVPGETAVVAAVQSGPELARTALAAWDDGEAILPINPSLPADEVARLLDQARPTHVIEYGRRREHPAGQPAPADTAAVVVTSGTTGHPKLVELTRTGMEVMGRGYSDGVGAGPADNWLACLPLHHVATLGALARAYVTGVSWTVHGQFDLDRVANSPRTDGTTIVSLVPTTLRRLLDHGAPLHEYRCVIIGGAPLPASLRERAEAADVNVVDAYGLTETWGGCALDGVPIRGVDMRLDDVTNEILVQGAPVMRRYRNDPTATTAAFADNGWLRTGDVGVLNGDQFRVVDRSKDIVITGGVNVSPTAVESVLATHPDVADVCVIGVADDEWGERVVACVVVRDAEAHLALDELRDFARDKLAPAQLPREVRLVDEIPRSGSGKPLRRFLRL